MPYFSILDQRQSATAAICRRHRVAELAVFGSAARGDFRSDSDVHFLVEFVPGNPRFARQSYSKPCPSMRDDRQRLTDILEAAKLCRFFRRAELATT